LLLTALLLERNKQPNSTTRYNVTLVESREDLGQLDPGTSLKAHRSWMIALAGHGLEAIRMVPKLYDDYVSGVGVRIRQVSLFLGAMEIKNSADGEGGDSEAYIVDRNFVVASMARYLKDEYSDSKSAMYTPRYGTELLYVDSANHQILTRDSNTGNEEYINYDLLVGADGARSTVRQALVKNHYDFEMDVGDIFQEFKAVHVTRPEKLNGNAMNIFPGIFPHMQGIGLPEPDGQINISIGAPRNKFNEIAPELKSEDPKVVAEYFKKNFKACELDDYDDFAEKWVNCKWNRTGMVHCNFYHSVPCKVVIMGDAAHATSPSIGMGMNTALRDAQKLVEILEQHKDDLEKVLPQFSKDCVKEGNSLSDLALHLYCYDIKAMFKETISTIVRSVLNKFLPRLVRPHPQMVIGNPKWSLSEVYQLASDQGIIQKHRAINQRIRQEHFERETGMITKEKRTVSMWLLSIPVAMSAYFFGMKM